MARKKSSTKKKAVVEEPPPVAADEDTEDESIHDDDGDVQMGSEDDIPDIVENDDVEEEDGSKGKTTTAKQTKKKDKKIKKDKTAATSTNSKIIPFMDTFYQLSSEDSPTDRAIAARDLIHHCFPPSSEEDSSSGSGSNTNYKDAAYALTRLMNGLCTGRAASRQGFASCLSSFIKMAYPSMEDIIKEDDEKKSNNTEGNNNEDHPAMIVRKKLLTTTDFLTPATTQSDGGGGGGKSKSKNKKNRFGGGGAMKGIEARDHAFGRLFGILAIVRSGTLSKSDMPSEVVERYTKDLIELYHYKNWMREPSAHALIELLSSLDSDELIADITNNTIVPSLFLSQEGNPNASDLMDREQWLQTLTPEQVAVALHLQTPTTTQSHDSIKFDYPLDEPIVTSESVSTLSEALASTCNVVYPRSHAAWDNLWMYLTEETKSEGGTYRKLRDTNEEEFSLIVEKIMEHVVVGLLLGTSPTNERRSLALQIVCALSGSSVLKIALPPSLIGSILSPQVVTGVFINVLCASGGIGKQKGGNVEHHLKPLTSQALVNLIDHCCEVEDNVERRMAFAKAFLLTEPRFDTKTKTSTVSSLLMLDDSIGTEINEDMESKRQALYQSYLSFLEEEIVTATSLNSATVYIELMQKLAKRELVRGTGGRGQAKRVIWFLMSAAFFDCSEMSDPSVATAKKSSKKKKKGKTNSAATISQPPQELSSGLRIKEILKAHELISIFYPAREIMAARFYSLLSEFVLITNSQVNAQIRANKSKSNNNEKGSRIYQALSEISGIFNLLESSGAKPYPSALTVDGESDDEDPAEMSKKAVLQVQNIANESLVKECDGSGDEDVLRAKAVFATSCASLMLSLHLQLSSCGKPDTTDQEDEEEEDDVAESVHEYISDLADCVEGIYQVIEGKSKTGKEDEENPLAMMAGILVNILSSPVGGEVHAGSPIQAAAAKVTRETVKLAWAGVISVINGLSAKNEALKNLVDEDVMSILIESVCGGKSMGDKGKDEEDDDSVEESDSSEDGLGDSAVFVNAAEAGMDLDEVEGDSSSSEDSSKDSDNDSKDSTDDNEDGDEDVELDPVKLENLLLEDSDAEMSDSGILEHHAGADKALAQLIKLKQEARKESQTERERIDLRNRLRCASLLLDSLFSPSVFKSGWLPLEAVLGSIVPILRSRKAITKSIASSTSTNTKKSLGEKNALLKHLTTLIKDKISKFHGSDGSSDELALKALSDIYEEMKHSLNVEHCSCCSIALITVVRCIPNIEDSTAGVKDIYASAIEDWSSRKATKIHSCVFQHLIERIPSLASLILLEPLIAAASSAHSPFLKVESFRLLSSIYKHDASNSKDNLMSKKAIDAVKRGCNDVVQALKGALDNSSLHKAKHLDEVLITIKNVINYVKAQDGDEILSESDLTSLQQSLKAVGDSRDPGKVKKLCSELATNILSLVEEGAKKPNKRTKAPKSSKKAKKSKTKK